LGLSSSTSSTTQITLTWDHEECDGTGSLIDLCDKELRQSENSALLKSVGPRWLGERDLTVAESAQVYASQALNLEVGDAAACSERQLALPFLACLLASGPDVAAPVFHTREHLRIPPSSREVGKASF